MYLIYPRSFVLTKKQLYSQAPFTMPDNHSIYEAGYIPCTYAILDDKSTIFRILCYDIHVTMRELSCIIALYSHYMIFMYSFQIERKKKISANLPEFHTSRIRCRLYLILIT